MLECRSILHQLQDWLSDAGTGHEVHALVDLPGLGWVKVLACLEGEDLICLTYRPLLVPAPPGADVELVCAPAAVKALRRCPALPDSEPLGGVEPYLERFFHGDGIAAP